MARALVIYHSKTGTTMKYAQQIGEYLNGKGIEAEVASTVMYRPEMLAGVDYIFLGCWTSGLFFVLQKPEQAWVKFAARLEGNPQAKLALFTTYKILTGSMFSNMAKHLTGKFAPHSLELKSRSSELTAQNMLSIDAFIAENAAP